MEKVKILFCSYSKIPSTSANSLAVIKMGNSLAKISNVILLAFRGKKFIDFKNIEDYYQVSKFKKILLPKQFLFLDEIPFALFALVIAFIFKPNICYSRDIMVANCLAKAGFPVFFEIHQIEHDNKDFNIFFKKTLNNLLRNKNLRKLICISRELSEECIRFGFGKKSVFVLHSGVSEDFNNNKLSKKASRKLLKLDFYKPTIVYTGSLQVGKGIEMIIKLAQMRPNYQFIIVGGSYEDIKKLTKSLPSNLIYREQVFPVFLKNYLATADVLILPYSRITKLKFHSPLKLFEYMSMGKPIIASNTWGVREIIKDKVNGLLVEPDDPEKFVKYIDLLLSDLKLSKRISISAYQDSKNYTWESRAKKLLALIRNT